MASTTDKGQIIALFTPSMKLAELIDCNHNLLSVLSRLDVSLGFGEHSIEQACRIHGVNVDSFLIICNMYNFEGYIPSQTVLDMADVMDIVKYLHNSHLDYVQSLRSLQSLLEQMMEPCSASQKKMIEKFYNGYRDEVRIHFGYEEDIVLPYVKSLVEGKSGDGYSIEAFEEKHGDIEEKLGDLKNLVMKYLPETCDQVLRYDVLHQIYHLEKDLTKHTLIEDNVLTPMVMHIESLR